MEKIEKAQKGAIWLGFLEKANAINENRSLVSVETLIELGKFDFANLNMP